MGWVSRQSGMSRVRRSHSAFSQFVPMSCPAGGWDCHLSAGTFGAGFLRPEGCTLCGGVAHTLLKRELLGVNRRVKTPSHARFLSHSLRILSFSTRFLSGCVCEATNDESLCSHTQILFWSVRSGTSDTTGRFLGNASSV